MPPDVRAALLAVAAAAAAVALGARRDEALLLRLNDHRNGGRLQIALRLASHVGLMPTHAAIWLLIAWFGPRPAAMAGVAFLLLAWAACRGIKRIVRRERPHRALDDARLVGREPGGSSFPSSHAALALYTALAAPSVLGWGPAATWAAIGLAALVGADRVYLGVHYPRDVLGGYVIGATAAALLLWLAS